jgi:hypothetical protein
VLIRGGAEAIEHALAASQHFTPLGPPEATSGAARAPLAYEYHP